jgi:hypothetical protein
MQVLKMPPVCLRVAPGKKQGVAEGEDGASLGGSSQPGFSK